jgi:hypothetical protein
VFRSFELKRADVATKANERILHLQQVAASEIPHIEPVVQALVEKALHAQLLAAVTRQVAWLDGRLASERELVAREGLELAPLARQRDRLRNDLANLEEGIAHLEKENAGLAAAATPLISAA